jgi:hypothetical protein
MRRRGTQRELIYLVLSSNQVCLVSVSVLEHSLTHILSLQRGISYPFILVLEVVVGKRPEEWFFEIVYTYIYTHALSISFLYCRHQQ